MIKKKESKQQCDLQEFMLGLVPYKPPQIMMKTVYLSNVNINVAEEAVYLGTNTKNLF